MKKILFILTIFLSFSVLSQTKLKGNKVVTIENREVGFFNKIIVKDDLKVILSTSNSVEVMVEADENLQEAIITEVTDNTLEVYLTQPILTSKKLMIYVKVTDTDLSLETRDKAKLVSETELSTGQLSCTAFDRSSQKITVRANNASIIGQNNADIDLTLNAEQLTKVMVSEGSSVKMNLKTELLESHLTGNGTIKPIGNCTNITVEAHDSGNFNAKDMLAHDVVINAFDKSDVAVNADRTVEVSAENNTEIYIYDEPQVVLKKFTDKASIFKK